MSTGILYTTVGVTKGHNVGGRGGHDVRGTVPVHLPSNTTIKDCTITLQFFLPDKPKPFKYQTI